MAITLDGTTGITSPGGDVSVSQSLSGNLTFTGTGNRITGDFSNATVANRVAFQSSTTNSGTYVHTLPNGTSQGSGVIVFNNSDPTNAAFIALTADASTAQVNTTITGTGTYLPMTFRTGGSERMRIDTSGNVGIGTSSLTQKLTVSGGSIMTDSGGSTASPSLMISSGALGTAGLYAPAANTLGIVVSATERARINSSGKFLVNTTATNSNEQVRIKTGDDTRAIAFQSASSAECGYIYVNAGGTSTTYSTSSDYRLKENIAPMTGALDKVAQLKPCTYTWKINGSAGQGFIAHELQEVAPYAVSGEKDGKQMQGVDYGKLTPILTAALQEAIAKIETLEARLAVLEAK